MCFIEQVKRKFRIKEQVVSPKPTSQIEKGDMKLKTMTEIHAMSDT